MKILDFHNHIFPPKIAHKVVDRLGRYYHYNMHGTGECGNLVRLAKEAGMTKVLVHSTATKISQVETINDYVAEQVKEQNGFFIGFGTLHQDYDNVSGEIERMKSLGLMGIKLHPDFQCFETDCDKMQRIYEKIGDKFPVLIHVGDVHTDMSSPKRLARMVKKFPEVTFIAAHFGGYSRWEESYEYLCGEDVYFDTSSSLDKLSNDMAMKMIRKHGIEKMLYASDYPIITHKECLERFRELPLSDEEFELVLWKNAAKLLNIEEEK